MDYIDVSEYFPLIAYNWTVFEKYFVNKDHTLMHFNNLAEFRNPEKHVREKNNVAKKLGEASLEWFSNIIG